MNCKSRSKHVAVALAALLAVAAPGRNSIRAATWEIGALVTDGNVGSRCAIARDSSGDFHVAYIRPDTDELILLSRAAGVWQPPTTVSGGVNEGTSFAVSAAGSGQTRFAWCKAGNLALMYAGPEPVTEWTLGDVTSSPDDLGPWLTLHQRPDSVLSITFRNQTTGSLVFMTRDALGAWSSPTTVDVGPGRGTNSDHAYRPGVGYSFSEQDNLGLYLLFADPEIAAHEWVRGTIRSQGNAGTNVSVAMLPSGRPACVYLHYDDAGLCAVHAAYAVGTADYWAVRTVVDSVAGGIVSNITPDVVFTSDWGGFVVYRDNLDDELQVAVNDSVLTGIGDDPSPFVVPRESALHPGFPNPFNPQATIPYSVATTGRVTLCVYDVRGALVRTLVDEIVVAGHHRTTWDGRDQRGERAASGVYFLRLMVGGDVRAGKIVLIK